MELGGVVGRATDESSPRQRLGLGLGRASAFDFTDFTVAYPFSDVKLVSASGAVLYGCRYNLAVRSPVCKRMLLSGMKEAQPMSEVVIIPFPMMRTEALQVLLEFCTSGCFSAKLVREAPVDVIHAARYFQLTDDMEEVIESVVSEMMELAGAQGGQERWAEALSLALECLPTDLDASFFEFLLKRIFSRSIEALGYQKLSARALEFLLSRSLACSDPWASSFFFYSSEFSIFRYLLHWSACQISEDAQRQLYFVRDAIMDNESFDIDSIGPGTAELLETIAAIAEPFLPLINFKSIHPQDIAIEIKPLKIVPAEMLLDALCHHALVLNMSSPIMYRGPYVLQWHPNGHSPDLVIDENSDGRGIYCGSDLSGFARTYSSLEGSGEHSWLVTVSIYSNPSGIGIGFCSDEANYCQWLGYSPKGWILDGGARFWHKGVAVMAADCLSFRSDVTEVQVTVNLDRRTCRFTIRQDSEGESVEVSSDGPWLDIPKLIYPAVSFRNSSGRVSLSPCEATF